MFPSGCFFTIPNKFLKSKSHLKTPSPPLTNPYLKMISQRNAMHFFIAFTLPVLLLQLLPPIAHAMKPKIHNGQISVSTADANKPKVSHGHDKAVSSSVAATKRLHIAHVGGLNVEIPPKNVGGLEKVVEVLIFEQIKAGHKVTLFCTNDSGKFEEFAEKEGFEKKYGITKEHFRKNFELIGSGSHFQRYQNIKELRCPKDGECTIYGFRGKKCHKCRLTNALKLE